MIRLNGLSLPLDHEESAPRAAALARLGVGEAALRRLSVARRGVDARKSGRIALVYTLDLDLDLPEAERERLLARPDVHPAPDTAYRRPPANPGGARPVVVGAGPCGVFAALILAEAGLRPLILERGRPVRRRTADTWGLWRRGVLDPLSNVQFGEGGAGTFSDGKLYSGVTDKRHLGRKVLEELVAAGAPGEILFVSKPHVGTFRLVSVLERLRAKIEDLGGEYRFEAQVADLRVERDASGGRRLRGLVLGGEEIEASRAVLAPGHSARDTMAMLAARGVAMEPKPFSIGVRIEHPQLLIDRARFGGQAGHPLLGAADYKLVHHGTGERSTYSFCMCPGGTVVAAASEPGRLATNGMSQYSRAERNANAGLVVEVTPEDCRALAPEDPLPGIAFQRHWEERAYQAGGGGYRAPGQRVEDFLAGRASKAFGAVAPSYKPGVEPADLAACLPGYVIAALREALPRLDRDLPGFAMADAVMTGVETRTSCPVRLKRGADGQSLGLPGLFPAGEGAGYAGGIYSAAIDGIRAAEAVLAAG